MTTQIDDLIKDLKERFVSMDEPRADNATYLKSNIIMCGFAVFSLKDSSLFKFIKKLKDRVDNLRNIYQITQFPSDTTMRNLLDEVPAKQLRVLG